MAQHWGHMAQCWRHTAPRWGHMAQHWGHMVQCWGHMAQCWGHMAQCWGHRHTGSSQLLPFPSRCSPHREAGRVVGGSAGRGRGAAGGAAALEGEQGRAEGAGDAGALPEIPVGTDTRTPCPHPGPRAAGGQRASAGLPRHPEPPEEGQGPPRHVQHHPHPVQLLGARGDHKGLSLSLQQRRRVVSD